MPTNDPRIDAYIKKAAPFAKPILKKLRVLVHKGCPGVIETVKWGMPSFEYPPKSILCGMAAFKQHAVFGFWKSAILFGDGKEAKAVREKLNWGAHGRDPVPARITSIKDLPSDAVIVRLVKQAVALNESGVKLPKKPASKKPPPKTPADFAAALRKAKGAAAKFKALSPSHKREYIEWVMEAKAHDTRARRIAQAVEWIAEGKSRNWKYERKK